jgi:hypothetical protein
MTANQPDGLLALRHAFGRVSAPEKLTQEALEGNNCHLRRLIRLKPGERAETSDLWEYTQDLLYTEIQGPLLAYLLPFCLELWREDLRGIQDGIGGFVEQFYPVLANRHVFEAHLTQKQAAAVSEYMRRAILDEIDDQRGLTYQGVKEERPYRWIRAVTTYGVLLPDLDRLWGAWRSLDTIGQAIAALQYISCLMYPENENPVFAPWTPNGGGGPPCLWDFEGHLYTHRWMEPNVVFLKRILNVPGVTKTLDRAVDRLTDQPEREVATQIQGDLPLLTETLEARCAELPRLLETTQGPSKLLAWSR